MILLRQLECPLKSFSIIGDVQLDTVSYGTLASFPGHSPPPPPPPPEEWPGINRSRMRKKLRKTVSKRVRKRTQSHGNE